MRTTTWKMIIKATEVVIIDKNTSMTIMKMKMIKAKANKIKNRVIKGVLQINNNTIKSRRME